jgi:hypothetical protein
MTMTDTADRRLVHRIMLAFMREVQSVFRRHAPAYYRANPDARRPCHSCAFNPRTNGWKGMDVTADNLRKSLANGTTFSCHQGLPWRTPMHEWTDEQLRKVLLDPTPCAGYSVCMQAPAEDTFGAFERAAREELARG